MLAFNKPNNSFVMMNSRIVLLKKDITKLKVDAIVNAANSRLAGGGGVDGAIHNAAGPQLLKECESLNGCPTGSAKITKAYNLPSKFVIHTVGPVWRGGSTNEINLLKSCYNSSLELAREYNIKSLAFSNVSTGIYGFPKLLAARIAVETVNDYLAVHSLPDIVYFVCFDEENKRIYYKLLSLK
jgi:O-acetyl-ADP-ribose deacetylase (regulator of RNase III)